MSNKPGFRIPWDDTKRMVSTQLLHRGPTLDRLLQWALANPKPRLAPTEPEALATYELVEMTERMYAALKELASATIAFHNALLRFEDRYANHTKSR